MAITALYLADKSALARLGHKDVSVRLAPLLIEGLIATCPTVDLELLYSARSFDDYEQILTERRSMQSFPLTEEVGDRATEVQRQLARRGQHRLPLPDLLIAATAEVNDLAVIHYDSDYDRIADITGQRAEWVVPRGSI